MTRLYVRLICAYFVVLYLFLLTRAHNDLIPLWFTIISQKKLIAIVTVSFAITVPALLLSKSRLLLVFLLAGNVLIPVVSHSDFYVLRSGSPINEHTIIARNNPFLDETENIRRIKTTSQNPQELWSSFSILSPIDAMLIVSAFYDFENEVHTEKIGCVGHSEETNFEKFPKTFSLSTQSNIGCCTDFAYMLASFLTYLEIENDIVQMPGHVANRAFYNDEWHYLDANTNLHISGLFSDDPLQIEYFPHPNISHKIGRYHVYNFQQQLISSFLDDLHFVNSSISFRKAPNLE